MANKSIDLTQFDDDFQSETPAERSDMERRSRREVSGCR